MPATKRKTVAQIITTELKRKKTNAEALAAVKKAHPYSTIGLATVNWYRCRLRGEGVAIPSDREARRK